MNAGFEEVRTMGVRRDGAFVNWQRCRSGASSLTQCRCKYRNPQLCFVAVETDLKTKTKTFAEIVGRVPQRKEGREKLVSLFDYTHF